MELFKLISICNIFKYYFNFEEGIINIFEPTINSFLYLFDDLL